MAAAAPPPPPLRGVSLAGLRALTADAGGRAALAGWTTGRLKADFILSATTPGVAYADVLAARPDGAALVGPATVFLSHAYAYEFLDALDAAGAWEDARRASGGAASFFYFDLAVVDQHAAPGGHGAVVSFEALRDTFGEGVRTVGHTLFLLRYEEPVSLSRAWCVFELAKTLPCGARLEVIMPPRDEEAFRAALVDDFASIVLKTCTVDVEKASAHVATDKDNIFRAIREDMGGFLPVNQLVIGAMREWMAGAGRAALNALPEEERAVSALVGKFARLLFEQGKDDEAAALFREALDNSRRMLGDDDALTLTCIHNYAVCLDNEGKEDEAMRLFREALKGSRRTLGDTHPDTLKSICSYANCLSFQGKYDEAMPLYREALEGSRRTLGDTHPDTLSVISDYATYFRDQGKYDEAMPLHREALEGTRRTLGDVHPDTIESICDFFKCLKAQGELAAADAFIRTELSRAPRPQLQLALVHLLAADSDERVALIAAARSALDHEHPLAERSGAGFYCDACGADRLRTAFSCAPCGFDLCAACASLRPS